MFAAAVVPVKVGAAIVGLVASTTPLPAVPVGDPTATFWILLTVAIPAFVIVTSCDNATAVGVGAQPGGHYEIYSHDVTGGKRGRLTGGIMPGAWLTPPTFGSATLANSFFYYVAP